MSLASRWAMYTATGSVMTSARLQCLVLVVLAVAVCSGSSDFWSVSRWCGCAVRSAMMELSCDLGRMRSCQSASAPVALAVLWLLSAGRRRQAWRRVSGGSGQPGRGQALHCNLQVTCLGAARQATG